MMNIPVLDPDPEALSLVVVSTLLAANPGHGRPVIPVNSINQRQAVVNMGLGPPR